MKRASQQSLIKNKRSPEILRLIWLESDWHLYIIFTIQLSNYLPEKLLHMDLMCPIVIKRIKNLIKAMWHEFSFYDAFTRSWKFSQNSKKNTCIKITKLIFRRIAVSELVILQIMVFTSGNFPHFCKTLWNNFFTRTPPIACFSIKLRYYCNVFFHMKVSYTKNTCHKSFKYTVATA